MLEKTILTQLKKYERSFPCMLEQLTKHNKILRHNSNFGYNIVLEEENLKVINRLQEDDINVFLILEVFAKFKNETALLRMDSYLYIDDFAFTNYQKNEFYVPTYTINHSWGIEEFGDIVIEERDGKLYRKY